MTNPLYENNRFTHLLPKDIELWKLFLASPANIYDYFDYDVRVGDGRDPGSEFPEDIRSLAVKLSQRRIDAVGHHQTHLAIIEITPSAGLKALGQLSAYPLLYQLKFRPAIPLKPILVTSNMETDVHGAFVRAGIPTLIYKLPDNP